MNPQDEVNRELESFREQWRAEVRAKKPASQGQGQATHSGTFTTSQTKPLRLASERPGKSTTARKPVAFDDNEEYVPVRVFDTTDDNQGKSQERDQSDPSTGSSEEPISALEYYERAAEKEAQGNLGESLGMYRKAFRMDPRVDQKYKNKHFAAAWASKPAHSASTAATKHEPNASNPSGNPSGSQPQSLKDLIAGFATLSIEPAPPEVEGTDPPPCPIAYLPEELLVHILEELAAMDVGDFVRSAQVCKRFAWLVATEDSIWRRVCLGREFGFDGMHRTWQKGISWGPADEVFMLNDSPEDAVNQRDVDTLATTNAVLHSAYSSSWQKMFRLRPRIRFNGCYISTVNYIRSGQASVNQITWNSPVHIVTYYRYLRFFRDGTVISLLTTDEPASVVHHLTKDLLDQHKGGAMPHLPSIVMKSALKGRWRLSSAQDNPEASLADAESDLFVETDGVDPKYMYRMELSLASAGKGTKNNKLVWRNFHSYNKLTDDWSDFGMRHDKPFFFSRVKSYGVLGG